MKRKRILGILMSILMVITMIPSFTFAADLPFTDVAKDAWYYNDVKGAYDTGLINGMTATTFEPESNMTYAQAVKLAACMNQKYSTGSVTLANGSPNWWDSYAAYAKEKNIINKDYDWNSNATRAGYVEIFAKALPDEALKEKNSIANGYIPDVGISHPQASAIYKLYRAGILTGMDEQGTFEPNSNIKRSEVSAILTRMMNESARKELTLGPVTNKVIFNSTGGSAVETQQVAENEKATKPADPTREGYSFVGWYSDDGLTKIYDFDSPVTKELILYAKWEEAANYKVSFESNGGSAVETQQVAVNEKATKPADPTKEGNTFDGWFSDSGLTTVYDFNSPVTENITLYAMWSIKSADPSDSGTVDLGLANIGNYVTFGHYEQDNNLENGKEPIEWKVLDKKDNRVLLLSKYGLDCQKYNETSTSVTWETCTLRNWLNSDFLNEAFSTSEKSAIPTVTISNPDNPNFGTEGGDSTNDQVFLLSLQEMQQYLNLSKKWTDYDGEKNDATGDTWSVGGSKDVITSPTAYANAQGAWTDSNWHDAEGKESCWWWLRSPGYFSNYAADVDYGGYVGAYGGSVDAAHVAVRPALWVNLAS